MNIVEDKREKPQQNAPHLGFTDFPLFRWFGLLMFFLSFRKLQVLKKLHINLLSKSCNFIPSPSQWEYNLSCILSVRFFRDNSRKGDIQTNLVPTNRKKWTQWRMWETLISHYFIYSSFPGKKLTHLYVFRYTKNFS